MTISALVWVPQGAAKEAPQRFALDDKQFEEIQSKIAAHIKDINDEKNAFVEDSHEQSQSQAGGSQPDFVKMFDLENYDNESNNEQGFLGNGGVDDENDDSGDEVTEMPNDQSEDNGALFPAVQNLAVKGESHDPYVTQGDDVDDAEELEEMMVAASDNLILVAKTEDDVSHVEVYLYEGDEDNLFVHHDIMLPSFPLCLEWMNYDIPGKGKEKGSYVAVGTFDPEIEIWDLDTIDAAYPTLILGTAKHPFESRGITRKKRASKKPHSDYHVDAVMCLSWNKNHPNLLASGSADTTIKLWDLSSASPEKAIRSFTPHKAKVQALAWNPAQGSVLLSGGYDNQAVIFDTRTPASMNSFRLTADVEAARWDPLHPERFLVSTEDGIVKCFDGRSVREPVFTIHAHDSAASALDISANVDGLIVTGGDRATKIWETKDPTAIRCLASKDLQVGKVYAAGFSPNSDLIVSVAGGAGKVVVWNLEGNANVRRAVRGADSTSSTAKKEFTTVEVAEEDDTDNDMDED